MVLIAHREALQRAVRMGARKVLEKPFDLNVLLALVVTSSFLSLEEMRSGGRS